MTMIASDPISPDTSILDVNNALYNVLNSYIDTTPNTGVTIIFDLPQADSSPTEPTLSVFLYEIHEDLQMRTAQTRIPTYNPSNKNVSIAPGWVNVNCNYIITYWDITQGQSSGLGSPGDAPDNPAIKIMNQVVNALVNNRTLPDIPGAYTRMIPPKDELNSLGNFWQSLGNKPRLSLNLSVTVPITLTDKMDTAPSVETVSADVEQISL